MDVDLKDQVAQVLSPDVARQLASTVGMDDGQGVTFVQAAVPALLSAFAGSMDHDGGAKALSDAVSNSDPNTLERLRRALGARDLAPLNEGANALSPVLGQGERDKLANALADYVGVPVEAALPALGAVEQAAISVLGQLDPSLWSDAGSIRNFFGSQKGALLAAIPAAFTSGAAAPAADAPAPVAAAPVEPTPVAAAPVEPTPVAAEPVEPTPVAPAPVAAPVPPPAPAPVAPRMAPPPPPPAPSSGGGTWLLVLIVIIVVAAAGYYYWTKTHPAAPAATGFLAPASTYVIRS